MPLLTLVNLENVSVEHALLREGTVAPVTLELWCLVNCQHVAEEVALVPISTGALVTLELL